MGLKQVLTHCSTRSTVTVQQLMTCWALRQVSVTATCCNTWVSLNREPMNFCLSKHMLVPRMRTNTTPKPQVCLVKVQVLHNNNSPSCLQLSGMNMKVKEVRERMMKHDLSPVMNSSRRSLRQWRRGKQPPRKKDSNMTCQGPGSPKRQ